MRSARPEGMALKRVARDVLPPTAMAAVDECLLLKDVKPTDAFAAELWSNLAHRYCGEKTRALWWGNGMRIVWALNTVGRRNEQLFVILLETDADPSSFRVFESDSFPKTAAGLISMSAFIKKCRALAERGPCPCQSPPKRMRLSSYDGCGECFLKE